MSSLHYSPEEMKKILDELVSLSDEAASLLKAMAHPARVLMLHIIRHSQCNVTGIEKALRISQSSASQHLRVLRLAGLIEPIRSGKEICYRIVDERVVKILDIFYSPPK